MTQENNTNGLTTNTLSSPVAQPAPENLQASGWTSLIPMVLIFFVFYFLLIRPQEKKRRDQESLISSIKVGEDIITNSGIFGKIAKIDEKDNTIILNIANNVEIKILISAIADIIGRNIIQKETKDEKSSLNNTASNNKANKKSAKKG